LRISFMGMLEENHLDFSTPLVNGLLNDSPHFPFMILAEDLVE